MNVSRVSVRLQNYKFKKKTPSISTLIVHRNQIREIRKNQLCYICNRVYCMRRTGKIKIAWLTDDRLGHHFDPCWRTFHGLFLLLLAFQEYGVRCGFWATDAAGWRPNFDCTAGTIRITNRDTIIERHEKCVGVSVKVREAVNHAFHVTCQKMKRWWPLQLPEYVSTVGDLYEID